MNRINLFLIMACLAVMLSSCGSDTAPKKMESIISKVTSPDELYGTWKLNKIDTLFNGTKDDLIKETTRHARKGLLINFFPDHVMTRIEGQKYTSAKWSFIADKSAVSVGNVIDGKDDDFNFGFDKLEFYTRNDTQNLLVENESGIYHFKRVSAQLANILDDPFHPVNNQWRVIAPKSESYAQMKQRLLNYTKHNHALFKSAKQRGKTKVVNANSIGIFVYYDGAIKIVDGGKVPSGWMSNFYSPDEAMDAYAFMDEYFKKGFIRKKHADGFVASGEAIFAELVKKMEETIGSK